MPLFRRALAATAEETAASTAASMASAAAAAMGGGASHDDVLSILARLAEEVQLPAPDPGAATARGGKERTQALWALLIS